MNSPLSGVVNGAAGDFGQTVAGTCPGHELIGVDAARDILSGAQSTATCDGYHRAGRVYFVVRALRAAGAIRER